MFNREQLDHMRYLDSIPAEQLCWCGWHRIGECDRCPEGYTAAHKIARRQSCCGWTPSSPHDQGTGHYYGCKQRVARDPR